MNSQARGEREEDKGFVMLKSLEVGKEFDKTKIVLPLVARPGQAALGASLDVIQMRLHGITNDRNKLRVRNVLNTARI